MPKGTPGKPIIICLGCGEKKRHYAKGLCQICYGRRWEREHREERATYAHCYYGEHREERLAYRRGYYEGHPEEQSAYRRRWQKRNPVKVAAYCARRAAHKKTLPDTLTYEQVEHLFRLGEAMYPSEKLHLDHIVPISKGGGTTWANTHFIPANLNCSKKDKSPKETYQQMELA